MSLSQIDLQRRDLHERLQAKLLDAYKTGGSSQKFEELKSAAVDEFLHDMAQLDREELAIRCADTAQ